MCSRGLNIIIRTPKLWEQKTAQMVHHVLKMTRLEQLWTSIQHLTTGMVHLVFKMTRLEQLWSSVQHLTAGTNRHTTETAQMVHLVFQATRLVFCKILQS